MIKTIILVLDTSYKNEEHDQLINDIVGKPLSFLEAVRVGGVGSKRMIVEEFSPNLRHIANKSADINYINIELRKMGVLIRFTKGLTRFSWAIPFYQLVFYNKDCSSIHAQGKYIIIKKSKTFHENKDFFDLILSHKLKYNQLHAHPKL